MKTGPSHTILQIAILLLAQLAFAWKASAQQDSIVKLAQPKWIRSHNADIKHLAIDLQFDWKKKQAYGTAEITFSLINSDNKVTLDAGMLTINSIASGGELLKYQYDGGAKDDGLLIFLDHNHNSGEEITIRIDYHTNWKNDIDPNALWGNNGKGLRFSQPTSNDPLKPREIWSMGYPQSNRYWFPGYDSPNDFRTTEFKATVDSDLTVISNGKLVETKLNTDGTKTFHWRQDVPYVNHLTSFVVGEYIDVLQNVDGVELHNYSYKGEVDATKASVEQLPDMVRFFSEVTGVKYPHGSYSQIFIQDAPWGIGYNTMAIQTENMVDDDRTHADFLYLWDGLEAEALANQWFGSYLTPHDWSHVWLSRSFAHYFDELYDEHKNGRAEFLLWRLSADHATYLADWNAGLRRPLVTKNFDDIDSFTGDNYSFFRGALVLHMLRKQLGEEKWLKAIRHYVRSNANGSVTTEDLRKSIEGSTGESMDWFFDQWVYKMGHPFFEVTKTYDAIRKQVTINIKQVQQVDPDNEYPKARYFQGKIEIEIGETIHPVWLEAKAENVFVLASPQKPTFVNIDFESTWTKEIKYAQPIEELLSQVKNSKDALARRSAMSQLAAHASKKETATTDKARITAALRDTALGSSYWRIKISALGQLQSILAPSTETRPVTLDDATIKMLLTVIKKEKSWVRAAAINFLGMTRNPRYADIYINALGDESDRVINRAAVALGKSKSPKAFDALSALVNKPSWKNQSLMSALNGLKELGDVRGFDIALKALSDVNLLRWRLPTPPVWDLRVFAVETIVSLGKADAAYALILDRFKKSMQEDDINGVFNNMLLITNLGDPRGHEIFELARAKFRDDPNAIAAIEQFELQLKEAVKNNP